MPKRKKIKVIKTNDPCPFCVGKTEPDYKNYEELGKFVTDRGKIVSRLRSGVCSRHQRTLTNAIKRSRHLGLLPFVNSV